MSEEKDKEKSDKRKSEWDGDSSLRSTVYEFKSFVKVKEESKEEE